MQIVWGYLTLRELQGTTLKRCSYCIRVISLHAILSKGCVKAWMGLQTFSEVDRTCANLPPAHASAQPIATVEDRLGPR